MYFYLTGTDYNASPISVREDIYRKRKEISRFWEGDALGSAVLVTCNRLEIYGASRDADEAFFYLGKFSKDFSDISRYFYVKRGRAQVFRHALKVASGLESQIRGETEIFKQVNMWRHSGTLSGAIKDLWDKVIPLSEEIRYKAGLYDERVNIANAVFYDLRMRLGFNMPCEIIVVGTGKVAELIARVRPLSAHVNFAAHKNYRKAEELAKDTGGSALPLADLLRYLKRASVLISATSSPHHILRREDMAGTTRDRHVNLHIYDLSMPRGVEPDVGGLDGVFLQNLDDLGDLFSRYNEYRQVRIDAASDLVENIVEKEKVGHDQSY